MPPTLAQCAEKIIYEPLLDMQDCGVISTNPVGFTGVGLLVPLFAPNILRQTRKSLGLPQKAIELPIWNDRLGQEGQDFITPANPGDENSKIERQVKLVTPEFLAYHSLFIEEKLKELPESEVCELLESLYGLKAYLGRDNARLLPTDLPDGRGGKELWCMLKPLEYLLLGSKTADDEIRPMNSPENRQYVTEVVKDNEENLTRVGTIADIVVQIGTLLEYVDKNEFKRPKKYPLELPGVSEDLLQEFRELIKELKRQPPSDPASSENLIAKNRKTIADEAAHELLRRLLERRGLTDWLCSEENTNQWTVNNGQLLYATSKDGEQVQAENGQKVLFVDPIDGTLPFMRGNDWAISIGVGNWCIDKTHPRGRFMSVAGLIFLPHTGELLVGWEGGGALVINTDRGSVRPLFGSGKTVSTESIVLIQLSGQEKNRDAVDKFITQSLPGMIHQFERMMGYGVGAKAAAEVALGRAEAYISPRSGGSWDDVAGKCIIEAIGGVHRSIDFKAWNVESPGVIIANNMAIYAMLYNILENYNKAA